MKNPLHRKAARSSKTSSPFLHKSVLTSPLPKRGNLYKKLYDAGMEGDVKAAEIYLNRTEGKAVDRIALKAEIDQDINVHAGIDDAALDAAILALEAKLKEKE